MIWTSPGRRRLIYGHTPGEFAKVDGRRGAGRGGVSILTRRPGASRTQ